MSITTSKLQIALAATGLRVWQIADAPKFIVDSAHMRPAPKEAEAGKGGYIPAVQGIGDALRELTEAGGFRAQLAAFIIQYVPIMCVQHDPATSAMSTSFGTNLGVIKPGGIPQALLLLSATFSPKFQMALAGVVNPHDKTTVGQGEYARVLAAGGTQDEAIRVMYKFIAWHEFGHIIDFYTRGYITQIMGTTFALQFLGQKEFADFQAQASVLDENSAEAAKLKSNPKLQSANSAIGEWIRSNISWYAATEPGETVGELTAMKFGGLAIPERLRAVADAIEQVRISTDFVWSAENVNTHALASDAADALLPILKKLAAAAAKAEATKEVPDNAALAA